MKSLLLTVLLVMVGGSGIALASDSSYLKAYLDNPSLETYKDWVNRTPRPCLRESDNDTRAQLFKRIRDADRYAFNIGIALFQCWDGGELADFYRSSGEFFDRDPSYFFRAVAQHRVSCPYQKFMITMLPLETTDDMLAKVVLIDVRLSLLSKTKGNASKSCAECIRPALIKLRDELSLHAYEDQ